VLHAVEREAGVRLIAHRQEDAGHDHDGQRDNGERAEIPEVLKFRGVGNTAYSFCIIVMMGSRESIQFSTGLEISLLCRPAYRSLMGLGFERCVVQLSRF